MTKNMCLSCGYLEASDDQFQIKLCGVCESHVMNGNIYAVKMGDFDKKKFIREATDVEIRRYDAQKIVIK